MKRKIGILVVGGALLIAAPGCKKSEPAAEGAKSAAAPAKAEAAAEPAKATLSPPKSLVLDEASIRKRLEGSWTIDMVETKRANEGRSFPPGMDLDEVFGKLQLAFQGDETLFDRGGGWAHLDTYTVSPNPDGSFTLTQGQRQKKVQARFIDSDTLRVDEKGGNDELTIVFKRARGLVVDWEKARAKAAEKRARAKAAPEAPAK